MSAPMSSAAIQHFRSIAWFEPPNVTNQKFCIAVVDDPMYADDLNRSLSRQRLRHSSVDFPEPLGPAISTSRLVDELF